MPRVYTHPTNKNSGVVMLNNTSLYADKGVITVEDDSLDVSDLALHGYMKSAQEEPTAKTGTSLVLAKPVND